MKNRFLAIAVLMLASLGTVQAQHIFNADSCKARALEFNLALQNADLEIEAAEQVKAAAFTKYFPVISAQAAAFRMHDYLLDVNASDISDGGMDMHIQFEGKDLQVYLEQLIADLGPVFSAFGVDLEAEIQKLVDGLSADFSFRMIRQGALGTVTAVQPVFAGGRIVNGNKLAGVGVEAARLKRELVADEVTAGAEQRYWLIVSLNEKLKTLQSARVLVDTLYRDVSAAYEASLISRNDLLRVKLKLGELQSAEITLNGGIALANMALCQYIGLPAGDSVEVADTVDDMYDLPLLPPSPDSAFVEDRTEYKLLQLAADAERLKGRMLVGEYLPSLGVGAGYSYSNLWGSHMNNAGVFVTLTVPITAWWEGSHKIKEQKIRERIAVNTRNDYSGLLDLQIRQTWNELTALHRQVMLARELIEQSEENLRINKDYYDAGMVPLSDLLEAQSLLQQSRDKYVDDCISYKLKHIEYSNMIF